MIRHVCFVQYNQSLFPPIMNILSAFLLLSCCTFCFSCFSIFIQCFFKFSFFNKLLFVLQDREKMRGVGEIEREKRKGDICNIVLLLEASLHPSGDWRPGSLYIGYTQLGVPLPKSSPLPLMFSLLCFLRDRGRM